MTSQTKENEKDTLGARLKQYETDWNERPFDKNLPLYARIDGRHFSSLTSGMGYPFYDLPLEKRSWFMYDLMRTVAIELMKEFKPDIIETHSDEISMGWKSSVSAPFEGRYFKLVSNIASYTGAAFYKSASEMHLLTTTGIEYEESGKILRTNKIPSFDCRVFQVPDVMELVNCFVWRQNDCVRGTINQYAQRWFSSKQLHGKTIADRLEMLRETGHGEFLDSEDFKRLKYGSWFKRTLKTMPMPEEHKKFNPEKTEVVRHVISEVLVDRLGPMSAEDKISVLFGE